MKSARSFFREGGTTSSGISASIPDDLIQAGRGRLVNAIWLIAGIYTLYLIVFQTVWVEYSTPVSAMVAPPSILFMLAIGLYLRKPRPREHVIHLGFLFHAVFGLSLAIVEYANLDAFTDPIDQISWNCVNILLLPLLVPATPRATFIAALVAAAMSPLGFAVASATAGTPVPNTNVLISLFAPPFFCALIAIVPSRVMEGMGKEVGKARRLGAYELSERLGEGGMGEVWVANHRMLARPAAVKLIRPDVLSRAGTESRAMSRFEREAQITASLRSPHTVELYDFGVADDGSLYYVMELLEGVDMQTLVDRHGPLPPGRVVHLLIQACESLEEAHQHGLVHRDVKPANLYVAKLGTRVDYLKVLDFGLVKIARIPEEDEDVAVTHEGRIEGTPAYLAPEQVLGDREIDGRADLYALGCVAWFLLTGNTVFQADTAMKMAIAHANEPPGAIADATERTVPDSLATLVEQCLSKDPDARPESAAALSRALRETALAAEWSSEDAHRFWRERLSQA